MPDWIIFECSGTRAGLEAALGQLNHGATLAVAGCTMDNIEIRLPNIMALPARVLGYWDCAPRLLPDALAMVLDSPVQVGRCIEKDPLDDINCVSAAVYAGEIRHRSVLVPSPAATPLPAATRSSMHGH
jgi:6-hydroxycyclohex-1-ene-1-carbonyl-CoA dehydrogenase